MELLRRIAVSQGDQHKKDAANAAIAREEQQIIASWNKELEAELWQKVLDRLRAQGYSGIGKSSTYARSGKPD